MLLLPQLPEHLLTLGTGLPVPFPQPKSIFHILLHTMTGDLGPGPSILPNEAKESQTPGYYFPLGHESETPSFHLLRPPQPSLQSLSPLGPGNFHSNPLFSQGLGTLASHSVHPSASTTPESQLTLNLLRGQRAALASVRSICLPSTEPNSRASSSRIASSVAAFDLGSTGGPGKTSKDGGLISFIPHSYL